MKTQVKNRGAIFESVPGEIGLMGSCGVSMLTVHSQNPIPI